MPLVRCPTHGRVYDDAKEKGCPLCLQEGSLPRAPGARQSKEPVEAKRAGGRMVLVAILAIVVIGAGGYYWYSSKHNDATRAQTTRDSLRALAAGPALPDTTKFAAPNDFAPIRRARALRAGLSDMLNDNRRTVLGLAAGPIDTAATDRATKRRVQQYITFRDRWNARLDGLTRNGDDFRYAPGVRYSLQMDNVTNQLRASLSVMRDMVRDWEVKSRAERSADIRAAEGYLRSASTTLSNLPR